MSASAAGAAFVIAGVLAAVFALGLALSTRALRRTRRALAAARAAHDAQARRLDTLVLLEAVADCADDAIFAKDLEGRYLLFNREAERVTGKRRSDVLGRDDNALFPPDQADLLLERGRRVLASGSTSIDEEILDTVDGARIFLATKGPLRNADGRVIGTFGYSRDVTERRRAEAAAAFERELLREMSLIGQIGGWEYDASIAAVSWTEGVAQILDIAPTVAPSGPLALAFVRAESLPALRAALAAAQNDGLRYDIEVEIDSATQRRKTVRVVGWPQIENGSVRRIRGLAQDVTTAHRLRAELEHHHANLERIVCERTEEAREARGQAEAASRAKSAFLANMSHEMRTPLNAILGLAQLLQRSPLTAQQAGRVRKIDESASHLLELVSDVLDLSKVESGGLTLVAHDFELGAVMSQVHDAIAPTAASKSLRLELETGPLPLWLRGDAGRLRQALLNFASNAVKFTAAGSVRLGVERTDVDADRVALRFEVKDTGIGIAADKLPRLFEMFEPGDASTTRAFDGSGLGLAITRRLASLMGGEVGVESELGAGSCFWLCLTLARGAAPAEPAVDAENLLRTRHGGMRVMVVEDNPVNREVAAELLDAAGLLVTMAENGSLALERIAADAPDLVLMDLQMPVMDGLEATVEIRRRPDGAPLPVIAMTANVSAETRRACTEAGMNDFVGKPVEAQQLYETLLRWMPPRRAGAAPAAPLIDHAATLARAGGNAERAQRLMRLFRDSHRGDVARLRALRESADDDGLRRLAHGLAGAGGNAGAVVVHRTASALEAAIAQGASKAQRQAAALALESALAECIASLESLAAPAATAESRKAGDPAATARQLLTLLAAGDMASSAFLAEHAAALQAVVGDAFAPLALFVRAFRFADAEAMLRALLEPATAAH